MRRSQTRFLGRTLRGSVEATVGRRARSTSGPPSNPRNLDEATVALHQKYHDATIDYVAQNLQWMENKGYATDESLSADEAISVAKAARARFKRWPLLHEQDTHDAPLGAWPQRFVKSTDAISLGDPADNVFVISLPRRPSRLKHALFELWGAGVSATIVDAVDGDAILCQEDVSGHGVHALPGYDGHKNHGISLTTGEVGCFMSHFTIWQHMVENDIPSAMILEDDFDFQDDFIGRMGAYLEEARGEPWNLMFVGRSPVESDIRRISQHIVEPGYTLWTVGYIIRLDAARALLDAKVERAFAPLDDYFSVAMGHGGDGIYNDHALWWRQYIPTLIRGAAMTPPLVMPYVGSMMLSDTAMLRKKTRYMKDLPKSISDIDS